MVLASRPNSWRAARVSVPGHGEEPVAVERMVLKRILEVTCALRRSLSVKASLFAIRMPFIFRSLMFVLSAAGFIATSTSTESPGVNTSLEENWIWKPLTPGSVPAGARISAG